MSITNTQGNKAPKTTSSEEKFDIRYVSATAEEDGTVTRKHHSNDYKRCVEESASGTGSYSTSGYNEKWGELKSSFNIGAVRIYNVGNQSVSTEGSSETYNQGTTKTTSEGDIAVESGRNMLEALSGMRIASNQGSVDAVPGASAAPKYSTISGNNTVQSYGDYNIASNGHIVQMSRDNYIVGVQEGDYALHVQDGNADIHVEKKATIYSTQDLLIQSTTKITLRVGSSVIVLTPDNIEIIAKGSTGRIDLNPGGEGSGSGSPL